MKAFSFTACVLHPFYCASALIKSSGQLMPDRILLSHGRAAAAGGTSPPSLSLLRKGSYSQSVPFHLNDAGPPSIEDSHAV